MTALKKIVYLIIKLDAQMSLLILVQLVKMVNLVGLLLYVGMRTSLNNFQRQKPYGTGL